MTPISYSCYVDVFCLSSTANELFHLFVDWDFLMPANCVGFSEENDAHRVKISKNTCSRYTSSRQIASSELLYVKVNSQAWAVPMSRITKTKINKKWHVTRIMHLHEGGSTAATILIKLGIFGEPRDVINFKGTLA